MTMYSSKDIDEAFGRLPHYNSGHKAILEAMRIQAQLLGEIAHSIDDIRFRIISMDERDQYRRIQGQ